MKIVRTLIAYLSLIVLGGGISGSASFAPDQETSHRIDSSYRKLWAEKQLNPAPVSSDEEFMRRAYLDITGRIPTAEQATAFLTSNDRQKRQQLLSMLVNSPQSAEYFASVWTGLFLGYRNDQSVKRLQFQKWLQEKLQSNTGWDKIATEMIVASGNLVDSPALNWYAKHRFDAANLADDTSRLFLGIQLGCARCHNHPHEKWKLDDFYGIAAFYSGLKKDDLSKIEKMQRRQLKQQREEMMEKYKTADSALRKEPEAVKQMRQEFRGLLRVAEEPSSSITAEIKGKKQTYPARFLLEPEPAHIASNQRETLAQWITSPDNPYFAHAFVNRVWGMLMGKGFVHPVDDMGGTNAPSNPQLLNEIAEDFRQHQFNIRHLVYTIANSETYQLSSRSSAKSSPAHYERGKVQVLNPDQLVNSFLLATSVEKALRMKSNLEFEERKQMMYLHHVFLFDNDDTKPSVEFEGTIPQALFLLNGKLTNEAVQQLPDNAMTKIFGARKLNAAEKIDQLFLHALSRRATQNEIQPLLKHVSDKNEDVSAYEDILWALLNSNEFLFNH